MCHPKLIVMFAMECSCIAPTNDINLPKEEGGGDYVGILCQELAKDSSWIASSQLHS